MRRSLLSVWPVLFTKGQPFVVSSRKNSLLLRRLVQDTAPVLFEGIQTTGWMNDLRGKKKFLRAHNVEHKYYRQLAHNSGGFRSMIYNREAQCLEEYESSQATKFDAVFCISPTDHEWFAGVGAKSSHLLPFHGFTTPDILEGTGQYLLYQGDLSIEINQRAILELIRMIPLHFKIPVVVAGRAGDSAFESKILDFANIRREVDVTPARMNELIRHAQVQLIHSLHAEGMKMKIYPALFQGRHILANKLSQTKTQLDNAIHFYERNEDFAALLDRLKSLPFTSTDIEHRKTLLSVIPSESMKARQIIEYL